MEDEIKALFLAAGHTEEEWTQQVIDTAAKIAKVDKMLDMYGYRDGDALFQVHGGAAAGMDLGQLFSWLDEQPLGRPAYIVNEATDGTVKVYRMLLPRVKLKGGFIV